MRGSRTLKFLQLQRFSATNLTVQVYDSGYVGLCPMHLPPKMGISHLHIFEDIFFGQETIKM